MSRNTRNSKFGNFDEISPKIKSNPANSARMAILAKFRQRAIELEIGVPTKRRFLANPANSARMAILAKFRQRAIELEIGVPTNL